MILKLTLKKKWFDMIVSGEKKEEYREIKDYWARRLIQNYFEMESAMWSEMVHNLKNPTKRHTNLHELLDYFDCSFKKIKTIKFTNGYRKNSPFIEVECLGIDVSNGKEEWGAERGKNYFVIKLGNILSIKEYGMIISFIDIVDIGFWECYKKYSYLVDLEWLSYQELNDDLVNQIVELSEQLKNIKKRVDETLDFAISNITKQNKRITALEHLPTNSSQIIEATVKNCVDCKYFGVKNGCYSIVGYCGSNYSKWEQA